MIIELEDTETQVVVPVVGIVVVAVRRPAVLGVVVPATAADNAVGAITDKSHCREIRANEKTNSSQSV